MFLGLYNRLAEHHLGPVQERHARERHPREHDQADAAARAALPDTQLRGFHRAGRRLGRRHVVGRLVRAVGRIHVCTEHLEAGHSPPRRCLSVTVFLNFSKQFIGLAIDGWINLKETPHFF